jgi:hypothetical protein
LSGVQRKGKIPAGLNREKKQSSVWSVTSKEMSSKLSVPLATNQTICFGLLLKEIKSSVLIAPN